MQTYLFLHVYNDMQWLDAYDAENFYQAIVEARYNHLEKNDTLQLIYISEEKAHFVDVAELSH